jgi:predicted permease
MEFIKPLSPVISVFLLIAAGFIFAQWKKIKLASVTEIIVYLGTPALVFSALAGKALMPRTLYYCSSAAHSFSPPLVS